MDNSSKKQNKIKDINPYKQKYIISDKQYKKEKLRKNPYGFDIEEVNKEIFNQSHSRSKSPNKYISAEEFKNQLNMLNLN